MIKARIRKIKKEGIRKVIEVRISKSIRRSVKALKNIKFEVILWRT